MRKPKMYSRSSTKEKRDSKESKRKEEENKGENDTAVDTRPKFEVGGSTASH